MGVSGRGGRKKGDGSKKGDAGRAHGNVLSVWRPLEGPSDDGDDAITSSLPKGVEPETDEGGAFIT